MKLIKTFYDPEYSYYIDFVYHEGTRFKTKDWHFFTDNKKDTGMCLNYGNSKDLKKVFNKNHIQYPEGYFE